MGIRREPRRPSTQYAAGGIPFHVRSRDADAALVPDRFEVLAPGIVAVHRWRPDSDLLAPVADADAAIWGLVARAP